MYLFICINITADMYYVVRNSIIDLSCRVTITMLTMILLAM